MIKDRKRGTFLNFIEKKYMNPMNPFHYLPRVSSMSLSISGYSEATCMVKLDIICKLMNTYSNIEIYIKNLRQSVLFEIFETL